MKPDSYIEWLVRDMNDGRLTQHDYQSLVKLSSNADFAALAANSGFDTALSKYVRAEHWSYVSERRHIWKTILDAQHCAMIRQLAFIQPFGYVLGMTLAQQYGFASELLDFTADIKVAAFFATHDAPNYKFEGCALSRRAGSDVGVVYRLPSAAGAIRHDRVDSYNYHTCPPQLHLKDVCIRFEDDSSPEMREQWVPRLFHEEAIGLVNAAIPLRFMNAMQTEDETTHRPLPQTEGIDRYLALYYQDGTGNVRYYRLLNQAPGSFSRSRLGRQSAVMIVPDELRIAEKEPGQFESAVFQAVEDVSQREGFERFYFRHSERAPALANVDREWLWPHEEDCFKLMISRVLDPSSQQYWFGDDPIPKRLDLVSPGYL